LKKIYKPEYYLLKIQPDAQVILLTGHATVQKKEKVDDILKRFGF